MVRTITKTGVTRKSLLSLIVASVLATLLMSVTETPVAQAKTHRLTVAQVTKGLVGQYVINSRLHVDAVIVGWYKTTERKYGTFWSPREKVVKMCTKGRPCPNTATYTFVMTKHGPTHTQRTLRGVTTDVKTAQPSSTSEVRPDALAASVHWWNPMSWKWSDVWKWTYEHIVRRCFDGALAATFGLGTTNLAAKFLLRGGVVTAEASAKAITGPQGLAIGAVAGCLFDISNQLLESS